MPRIEQIRERLRQQLRAGKLDQRIVELEVREHPLSPGSLQFFEGSSLEEIQFNMKDLLSGMMEGKGRKRRMPVAEAADYIVQEEEQKLVDMEQVARLALDRVEQSGIIFLDEIDKIAGREAGHGPDVSREGVQRDILPIVKAPASGRATHAAYRPHSFYAAGAFHYPSRPTSFRNCRKFPIRGDEYAERRRFRSHTQRT
jgi:ATP-dependent HslUV protease ATP-binding subunit HslU